jgi:hypothetical protein
VLSFFTTNKKGDKMKALLFNGSPHKNGCAYTALDEIAKL